MFIVRCKVCNVELKGGRHPQACGCSNMMTVTEDKVTALDINQVVVVKLTSTKQNKDILTSSDLMYQEERRKRKVRKMNFDVR